MTPEQKELRLVNVPSFLDFICYLQFLPTSVMGPGLEYSDYISFINKEHQYAKIPNSKKVVLKSLLEAIVCLVIYQVLAVIYFPISYMTTDEYLSKGGWWMFGYSWLSVTFLRFKYYFAWKLNSCGIHASGLSYNKTIVNSEGKQEDIFSKHNNANILTVEGTWHIKDKIGNWNIAVQNWLRKCVYERSRSNG